LCPQPTIKEIAFQRNQKTTYNPLPTMEMRGMSGELLGTIGSNFPSSKSEPMDAKLQTSTPTAPPASTQQNPKAIPPLPPSFLSKKPKILDSLHPPDQDYTDKSPKGSIDAEIKDLIDEINAFPGLITTSSCAGRVSVFLEGLKTSPVERYGTGNGDDDGEQQQQQDEASQTKARSIPVPGGKGFGGRWLFVSHEPLGDSHLQSQAKTWSEVFHLSTSPYERSSTGTTPISGIPRLIKFAFEPLILHVLCADLKHAAPLLAAAVNAGFRESGVQSLKVLDAGDKGGGEGVMVGIRTAGLGIESLIGVLDGAGKDGEECCRAIVGEEYLDLLVRTSEERFKANEERRERFRMELRDHMARFEEGRNGADGWEDKDARARRKRREGLQRKEGLRRGEMQED
jgi:tRNA wybutosine-synthesizing protein 3